MKEKLVYGIVFGGAFVIVTVAIIYMNSMFNNIFKFDFTPPQASNAVAAVVDQENTEQIEQEPEEEITDDLQEPVYSESEETNNDTAVVKYEVDKSLLDSLNILRNKIALLEKQQNKKNNQDMADDAKALSQREDSLKAVAASESKKMDEKKFELWAKETAKLYESMDPKKAAKIIQSYSDNESREVIFKMNKKKAAKILAELDPEIALRITKAL